MKLNRPFVVFLRHGSTEWNEAQRWQGGEVDFPLSEYGRRGVVEFGKYLSGHGVDETYSLISSSMKRAVETAELLSTVGIGGGPVRQLDGFREARLGLVSGMTESEIRSSYPRLFAEWESGGIPSYPQGESVDELTTRLALMLIDLIQRDEAAVVVVHKTVLRTIRMIVGIPAPPDEGHLSGVGLWRSSGGHGEAVWRNLAPPKA